MIELPVAPLADEVDWFVSQSRAPTVRSMADWAEESIRLPNGPAAGERYRHWRHPVSRVFFNVVDSGRWSRIATTGPTQNGKTLMAYVIPTLHHLFEIGETVVVGLPTLDMANDKWAEDFLPVIQASKYRDLLPNTGEGSRGGQVKRGIRFRNGVSLRWMTAGGDDKHRSAYTTRVVSMTEVDGMDESGEASRESDKIEQMEARTRAFGRTGKRIYMECTVSIERGRIWQEITNGTDSKLIRPCPHCEAWVTPEREHLVGWHGCESSEEAAEAAHFACPACESPWSESDRKSAARDIQVIHRGQEVDSGGTVIGDPPKTQTLGFRWSAIDNPFTTAADLGAEEWLAAHARDHENAEKKMRQFIWSLPYEPPEIELTPLVAEEIEQRSSSLKKGIVPDSAADIAIGVDTGKRMLHWTALAIGEGTGGRVIEYGKQPVAADKLGVKQGLMEALSELAHYFGDGWSTESGDKMRPSQVWIDAGYHEHTDGVYAFCAAANKELGLSLGSELYRPTKGYGEKQRGTTRYHAPTGKQRGVVYMGTEFHVGKVIRNGRVVPGVLLVHMNSDHWKSELHQRLMMPEDEPLAVTLYEAASHSEHAEYSRHLTAEKQVEEFIPGRGEIIRWERVDRQNHWLDSTYAAVCAGEAIMAMKLKKKASQGTKTLAELAQSAR